MNPGDSISVRNHLGVRKTVQVVSVMRGRAVVSWPLVGEYEVDMVTGDLFVPGVSSSSIYDVDMLTGRLLGTRANVEDPMLLDGAMVGAELRLDTGDLAQVVDVLRSEGTMKVFVDHGPQRSGEYRVARSGWCVLPDALDRLRARAGCVAAAS